MCHTINNFVFVALVRNRAMFSKDIGKDFIYERWTSLEFNPLG